MRATRRRRSSRRPASEGQRAIRRGPPPLQEGRRSMHEEGGRGRRGWGRERGAGGSCRREEGRNLQRHPGIDAGEMPPKRPRGAPNRRRSPKKDTQRAGRADHRAYRAYHRAYRAYQRRAYERCCNPYRDGHRAYQAYRKHQPRTLTEHTPSIPRAYREHTASIPPASISISRALTFHAAFARRRP